MQSWWRQRPQVLLLSAAPMSVPSEEDYLINYSSGTLLIMSSSIMIRLRDFQKTLYMVFHVFQGKSRLVWKKIPPLLFITWVWKGEDVPHSIPYQMLTALILVRLDGYCWLSLSSNGIKLGRSCILGSCFLCLSFLFEGL